MVSWRDKPVPTAKPKPVGKRKPPAKRPGPLKKALAERDELYNTIKPRKKGK